MTTTAPQRLVSADDHVALGHAEIKANLATKYHDAYDAGLMRFAQSAQNTLSIEANERWRTQQGLGDPDKPVGMQVARTHAAANRPGHTDPVARLADMDADGVAASSCYCEVSAFRYLYLIEDGWAEATRAFNTTLGEFAAADPQRLVVAYQIPIHDIDAAVAEVQWVAEHGGRSIQLPVYPAELGLPDYWDERYDPLFTAITEADLPISCHIGMNTSLNDLALRDPTPQKGVFVPMVAMSAAESLGMWVLTGVFERFPGLRVVFVEPGLGWVAWWLDIVDDLQARQGYDFPALRERPSDYFHRNVFLTFVDEPHALRLAEETLGVDNVMWSSDYPHPVSSWPRSQEIAREMFGDADPAARDKILFANAERVWRL